jgi:dCMP deaminase
MSEQFEGWEKPQWNDWYMAMAFVVAQRSIDTSTKHGAVVVNDRHQMLSMGYNGPPPGCNDELIPMIRPEKYKYFEHAEANAMNNANCSLKGATVYVTGHPCSACFRQMLCKGIKTIVYGHVGSQCVDEEDLKAINIMNTVSPIRQLELCPVWLRVKSDMGKTELCLAELIPYEGNGFVGVLEKTLEYQQKKNEQI